MVTLKDLKKIYLMDSLPSKTVKEMLPAVDFKRYKEREVIFEEGDKAERFFMLKRGKVLLEVELSANIIISLGSIKAGFSFGWSSLIPGSIHASYAISTEPCEVLSIPGEKLLAILAKDPKAGRIFMEEAFKVQKRRLERRTGQFLKVISKHPDMKRLVGI
jgi:CRP/FNR family cyclic AMP-dependent transcriptional regulator